MVVWRNTDRFNFAYAVYHGRFGKTIGELANLVLRLIRLVLLEEGEYILCFACTFRDINTTEGILTWAKVTLIKKI